MSRGIVEAHTFFTTREALLESLSLSATRRAKIDGPLSDEEIRLLLGQTPGQQWSLWLPRHMRDDLKAKQLKLIYISSDSKAMLDRTPVFAEPVQRVVGFGRGGRECGNRARSCSVA